MAKEQLASIKDGELQIGAYKMTCAVLNDKNRTRVLSQSEVVRALGRAQGGSKRGQAKLPRWISAANITPYISTDLMKAIIEPIEYKTVKGSRALGIEAKFLPEICNVWLQASDDGVLTDSQKETAARANILIRGLANVGIIALVDEATGYQYEREKSELQAILKAYISEELLPWQKRFPDEFYKEIFRLNKWDFTVSGIKQRPGVIGKWTNKIVYKQLPKGVLQELKDKTPKSETGNYKARFHQSLTPEIGNPHLERQLISIITLMNISKDWKEFMRFFNKKFGQQELDFPEND